MLLSVGGLNAPSKRDRRAVVKVSESIRNRCRLVDSGSSRVRSVAFRGGSSAGRGCWLKETEQAVAVLFGEVCHRVTITPS